jgi:hypothetical protein
MKQKTTVDKLKQDYPPLDISSIIGNIAATTAIGTGAGRRYCDTG